MKNDNITLNSGLLIKSLTISFLLIAAAFATGLVIGKNSNAPVDRTSADQNDINQKLSDCSYKLQEITNKHINLVDIATDKGLLDDKGRFIVGVNCSLPQKNTPAKFQKADVSASVAQNQKQKNEKKCLFSIQIFSDTNKDLADSAKMKYNIPDTKLVEALVNDKIWYRVRYGCFSSRAEAEQILPEIKEMVKTAIIVSE